MGEITMTGTSGIDVSSMISQLTALKQMEVTRIAERKTSVNKQLDAYTKLNTYLQDFITKAGALNEMKDFSIFKSSSSDDKFVTVSANEGSPMGDYSVQVDKLAQKEKYASSTEINGNKITDINQKLSELGISDGKIAINGTIIDVKASDSVADLRDKINKAKDKDGKPIGVNATILNIGKDENGDNNFRMVLTANETGKKGVEYEDVEGNILETLGFIGAPAAGTATNNTFESEGDFLKKFDELEVGGKITIKGKDADGKDATVEIIKTQEMADDASGQLFKDALVNGINDKFGGANGDVTASIDENGVLKIVDNVAGASYLQINSMVTTDVEKPQYEKDGVTPIKDKEGNQVMKAETKSFSFDNSVVGKNLGVKNDANKLAEGQDAEFWIDGIFMTSSSNSAKDVVEGVTFELKKVTEPGETVEVSLSRDKEAVTKKIEDIINVYNNLLAFQDEQTSFSYDNGLDENGETKDPIKGPLFGDSTIKSVTSGIKALFTNLLSEGGTFRSLSEIGVSTDWKTGKLTLDKEKLGEALDEDFEAVADLFITQGKSSNPNIEYGRSSADTQDGTYEIREIDGGFQIRRAGEGDNAWVSGKRSGNIVTFEHGPAKGLMITAPKNSGGNDGSITTFEFSKGLAGAIEDKMKQMTDRETGIIVTKRESLTSRMKSIDSQIEMAQRRVNTYRENLVKQFAAMELKIQQMNSQQQAMIAQFQKSSS